MPVFLPKWYLPYTRFFDNLDPPEELDTLDKVFNGTMLEGNGMLLGLKLKQNTLLWDRSCYFG